MTKTTEERAKELYPNCDPADKRRYVLLKNKLGNVFGQQMTGLIMKQKVLKYCIEATTMTKWSKSGKNIILLGSMAGNVLPAL